MARLSRMLELEVRHRAAGRCEYCLFPESASELMPLFNPRADGWADHFAWDDLLLRGKTGIGRATVAVLDINHVDSVTVRAALREEQS